MMAERTRSYPTRYATSTHPRNQSAGVLPSNLKARLPFTPPAKVVVCQPARWLSLINPIARYLNAAMCCAKPMFLTNGHYISVADSEKMLTTIMAQRWPALTVFQSSMESCQ